MNFSFKKGIFLFSALVTVGLFTTPVSAGIDEDIAKINDSVITANTGIQKAEVQLGNLVEQIQVLNQQLVEQKATIKAHKAEIAQLVANLQGFTSKERELKQQTSAKKEQLKEIKASVDSLMAKISVYDTNFAQVLTEVQQIINQSNQSQLATELAQLSERAKAQVNNQEAVQLRANLEEKRLQLKGLQRTKVDLTSKIKDLKEQQRSTKQQIKVLKAEQQEAQRQLKILMASKSTKK